MAARLPAEVADRLIKLLGMLGSDHEGEALNAARLADRLVRDQLKLTRGEVIQPQGRGASGPDPPRVWREPVTWQEAARLSAQWPECLTEWEQGFLVAVVRFPRVSEKQLAILDRLVRKARGTAGVHEPADPTAWHTPRAARTAEPACRSTRSGADRSRSARQHKTATAPPPKTPGLTEVLVPTPTTIPQKINP